MRDGRPLCRWGIVLRDGRRELTSHEDVVDVMTIQQELLSQDAFDLEAAPVIQAARGSVGAEHSQRDFACSTTAALLHGRLNEPLTNTNPLAGWVDG